jgi:hypothetical protein
MSVRRLPIVNFDMFRLPPLSSLRVQTLDRVGAGLLCATAVLGMLVLTSSSSVTRSSGHGTVQVLGNAAELTPIQAQDAGDLDHDRQARRNVGPPVPVPVVAAVVPPVDPATALLSASALASDGIPLTAVDAYKRAAAREAKLNPTCGIPWTLVAAIGRVESDHGRFNHAILRVDGTSLPKVIGIALDGTRSALIPDTDHGLLDGDPVYDRAIGPMQFIPSTWARYGVDGNDDKIIDPFNIYDAAAATAHYLCAAGKDLHDAAGMARAVFSYNHLDSYVAAVLALQVTYAGTPPLIIAPVPVPTTSAPSAPATIANTPTPTPSCATPTAATGTATGTATATATATGSATATGTATGSPTPTGTSTGSATPSPSPTHC